MKIKEDDIIIGHVITWKEIVNIFHPDGAIWKCFSLDSLETQYQ